MRRGLIFIAVLLSPLLLGLLFAFEVIKIPFPTDMAQSAAVGYQEGPRIGPPEGAVPIHGEDVIPEEIPVNPVPADDVSLQRGMILYSFHCELCHGALGRGDGPLSDRFARTPEDLRGTRAAAEFDGSVYLAIRNGFGEMPSLGENLTVRERWDVVNYIRTFPSSGD
jgi:mono/diheme cytochrome c family protein